MRKLILVLAVLAFAAATIPAVRDRVPPSARAAVDTAVAWLERQVRAAPDAVFRWSAKTEARNIARRLREREVSGQPLPAPENFDRFVRETQLSGRNWRDPWGQPYFMTVLGDSLSVGSPGPDLTPGTADDIIVTVPRP